MKRSAAIPVFLAAALAAASAHAEVVGTMADASSGALWPAAVESRITNIEAQIGVKLSCLVTNFYAGQASCAEVDGHVVAVHSDVEDELAVHLRFDTNFPSTRLEWENWIGSATSIAVDATNGYAGTLDAAPAHGVTNGAAFFASGDTTPHWIDVYDDATQALEFHPSLPAGETVELEGIVSAVLDSLGIHCGEESSTNMVFKTLSSSPSGNNPALATADGVTVYMSYSSGKVWKSVDGGSSWAQLSSSPSGDRPALATADGVTVYMSYINGKVWKSVDEGSAWDGNDEDGEL